MSTQNKAKTKINLVILGLSLLFIILFIPEIYAYTLGSDTFDYRTNMTNEPSTKVLFSLNGTYLVAGRGMYGMGGYGESQLLGNDTNYNDSTTAFGNSSTELFLVDTEQKTTFGTPNSDLIFFYPFDNNDSTIILEYINESNLTTKVGTPKYVSDCVFGGCMNFSNGDEDSWKTTTNLHTNWNHNFTIGFWFKTLTPRTSHAAPFNMGGTAFGSDRIALFIYDEAYGDTIMFATEGGNAGGMDCYNASLNVSDGEWHSVVGEYIIEPSNVKRSLLYVDGTLHGNVSATKAWTFDDMDYYMFGEDGYTWNMHLEGYVDNAFAKTGLMTSAEVEQWHNNSLNVNMLLGIQEEKAEVNATPTIIINSPANGTEYSNETLSILINYTSSDTDLQNVTLYLENGTILQNNESLASGSHTITYSLSVSEGNNYSVFVNSTDDNTVNTTGVYTYIVKTVGNTPPELILNKTYGEITHDAPPSYEDIKFNITCLDSDLGQTITAYLNIWNGSTKYTFYNTTVSNNTQTDLYTLSATYTKVGEVWKGEFWCGDGTVNTTEDNDSVTIENTAPVLVAYDTAPNSPTELQNITFNITCSDTDSSQTITAYIEIHNGTNSHTNYSTTVVNNTNKLLVTLSGANVGETWNATYWCGDGTANTSKSSEAVTVVAVNYGEWNWSYEYRENITSKPNSEMLFAINGTDGLGLYGWSGQGNIALYYNDTDFNISELANESYDFFKVDTDLKETSGAFPSDLIFFYPFDNNDSIIIDYINESNLTIEAGSPDIKSNGKFGGAVNFASGEERLRTTTNLHTNWRHNWSIGMWFKTNQTSTGTLFNAAGTILTTDRIIFTVFYDAYGDTVMLTVEGNNGAVDVYNDSINVTDNQWHYVVGTYNNATRETILYLDGVAVGSGTRGAGVQDDLDFYSFGDEYHDWNLYFEGLIDNAFAINRILTPSEVEELNNNSLNVNMMLGTQETKGSSNTSIISLNSPSDGQDFAYNVTSVTLNISITDPDGELFNVTWYNATNNAIFNINSSITNGSDVTYTLIGLTNNKTVSWFASILDLNNSEVTNGSTWTFILNETVNYTPTIIVNFPTNNDTNYNSTTTYIIFNYTTSDTDVMNATCYWGNGTVLQNNESLTAGSHTIICNYTDLLFNHNYTLFTNSTDGNTEATTGIYTVRINNTYQYTPTYSTPQPTSGTVYASGKDNVTLNITVFDLNNDTMNVTFYGRIAGGDAENFTIMVIPDTQRCTSSGKLAWCTNITQYINDSADEWNTVIALMVGDIVEVNQVADWNKMNGTLARIESVPLAVVAGNHDIGDDPPFSWTNYDNYMPLSRFSGMDYFLGSNASDSRYTSWNFTAGGDEYLIVAAPWVGLTSFEWEHDWINETLENNSGSRAIILTHQLLSFYTPLGEYTDGGDYINETTLDKFDNIDFVISGHYKNAQNNRTNSGGTNSWYEIQKNYQWFGGDYRSYMAIMKFVPNEDKMYAYTYSPYLDVYNTSSTEQYVLDYDMTGGNAWSELCTDTNVPNGSVASCNWAGILDNTTYEWYAVIDDGTLSNTTETYNYTINDTPNTAPILVAYDTAPNEPTDEQNITGNITCADSDSGDNITAYLEVHNDSVSILNYSTTVANNTNTLLVTLTNNAVGETFNLTYWCGDGTVNTSKSSESVIVSSNNVPSATQPTLTPATVYSDEFIYANSTITDADNNITNVTFKWYLNGANVWNQTNLSVANGTQILSSLNPSNYTLNDKINCSVNVTDGTNSYMIWSANTITISNNVPNITLNSPLDNALLSRNYVLLNVTVTDSDADNMNVTLYNLVENISYATNLTDAGSTIQDLFSDDDYIYSCGIDTNVQVYYKSNLSLRAELTSAGTFVNSVFADEDYIYAGGADTNVQIYYKNNLSFKQNLTDAGSYIYEVYVDDEYIYAGGRDNRTQVYYRNNLSFKQNLTESTDAIRSIFADNDYVYIGGDDNRVQVYYRNNLSFKQNLTNTTQAINSIYADDDYIYAGIRSFGSRVVVYYKNNLSLRAELTNGSGFVNSIYADEDYIYAGGDDEKVQVWHISNLSLKTELIRDSTNVNSVFVDDDYIYAGAGTELRLYYKTRRILHTASINSGENVTYNWTSLSYGSTYNWYITATDNVNTTTSSTYQFTVNTVTSATQPTLTPSTVYNSDFIYANSTVTDADNDDMNVTFIWYVNGTNVWNQTNLSITNNTVILSSLNPSNYSLNDIVNCSVNVTDGTNSYMIWSANTITISNNVPNTPPINSPADNQTYANGTTYVLINSTYSDPEGDVGNLSLYNNDTDTLVIRNSSLINNTDVIFNWTGLSNGTYCYNVEATDIVNSGDSVSVVQCFTINDSPANTTAPWDISNYSYESTISSSEDFSQGIFFSSNGNKLYEIGLEFDNIYQYNCTIAWNLSTCTYEANISTQSGGPTGMFFKPDGTRLYELGNNPVTDRIYQYNCTIAWNISSCSYNTTNLITQDSVPTGMFFKPDGTRLYETGYGFDRVSQYSCSQAWNVSSCSFTNNLTPSISNPESISFKPDGTQLFIASDKIYQYNCSQAWNVSSCSSANKNLSVDIKGMFFKPDGTIVYFSALNQLYQYDLGPSDEPNWNITLISPTNGADFDRRDYMNLIVNVTNVFNQTLEALFYNNTNKVLICNSTNQYVGSTPIIRQYTCNWTGISKGNHSWFFNVSNASYIIMSGEWNFTINNTVVNNAPNITLNSPSNGALRQSTTTVLNVTVIDSNADNMNVSFYQYDIEDWWNISYTYLRNTTNTSSSFDLLYPFVNEDPDGDASTSTYYGQDGSIYYSTDSEWSFANDTSQKCGFSTFEDGVKSQITHCPSLSTGLQAYWTFDNDNVWDAINENNGTIYGTVATGQTGKVLYGYTFDGDTGFINVSDSASLSPTTGITISVWVKYYDGDIYQIIVDKFDDVNNGYRLNLYSPTNTVAFGVGTNVGWKIISTSADIISKDAWYYITGTYDGSVSRIYVNAIEVKNDTFAAIIGDSADYLYIGKSTALNFAYLNGTIDDLRIYNRSLSAKEIEAIYNATSPISSYNPTFETEETIVNTLLNTSIDIANGSTAQNTWNGLSESTIYYWYVNVTDGIDITKSSIWNFTINNYPKLSTNISIPTNPEYSNETYVSITTADLDSDTMDYCKFTITGANTTTIVNDINGTEDGMVWNSSEFNMSYGYGNYEYNVTCSDGNNTVSTSWNYNLTQGVLNYTSYGTWIDAIMAGNLTSRNYTFDATGENSRNILTYIGLEGMILNNFTLTYSDNISVLVNSTNNIFINLTANSTLAIGSYSGNITFNRTDGYELRLPVNLTIANTTATLTPTPSTKSYSMDASTVGAWSVSIANSGTWNATECNGTFAGTIAAFSTINNENFTVLMNDSTSINVIHTNPSSGSYSGTLTISCIGSDNNDSVTTVVDPISLTVSTPSAPPSGGGGGTPSEEDTRDCDIGLPTILYFEEGNNVRRLLITNNDEDTFLPSIIKLSPLNDSLQDARTKIQVVGSVTNILPTQTLELSVVADFTGIDSLAGARLKVYSDECNPIEIPVILDPTGRYTPPEEEFEELEIAKDIKEFINTPVVELGTHTINVGHIGFIAFLFILLFSASVLFGGTKKAKGLKILITTVIVTILIMVIVYIFVK